MLQRVLTSQAVSNPDYPVAATRLGKLRGTLIDDTFVFRGIQYATAERFKMPVMVSSWEGVRDAVVYGSVCHELKSAIAQDAYEVPHFGYHSSEHCHNLNIWTSTLDTASKKAVMVWIHGGGWHSGSSVEQFSYDGASLSCFGDVVVVSVNHRLNCFGYLDLSSVDPQYADSGVAGLGDLVMALQWVQDNITAFGGDPDNVTIFGQSGGGSKVLHLMQTPAADGLYHKAIVQSGGAKYGKPVRGKTIKECRQILGERVAHYIQMQDSTFSTIDTVPTEALIEAVGKAQRQLIQELCGEDTGWIHYWEPAADGVYTLGSPFVGGIRTHERNIPMLFCTVFGEHCSNQAPHTEKGCKNLWNESTKLAYINEKYGYEAGEIITAFAQAYPERNIADVLYIDRRMRKRLLSLSRKYAKAGSPVWNALFDIEFPLKGGVVAWHCSEIPFVFCNADYMEASYLTSVGHRVQHQMAAAWSAFAKIGTPNHMGLPEWPQVEADTVPTMVFGDCTQLMVDHDRTLLDKLPALND